MIDINLLREKPEQFRKALTQRDLADSVVDDILELDKEWRTLSYRVDTLREERNIFSKDANSAKKNAKRLSQIKNELSDLDEQLSAVTQKRLSLLLTVPNILAKEVPIGAGESANKVIKKVGKAVKKQQLHDELMSAAGWLDTTTSGATSGARFRYLMRDGAIAQMRLMRLAMDFAVSEGFIPVLPPTMAREKLFEQGGFLPTGREDMFVTQDDLFLAGTSEPLLVALAGKGVDAAALPLRFVGFSTCYRREAGSYGKDTKGMFRLHQFDKVEMVSIVDPSKSAEEHEFLLEMQKKMVEKFDLPYQVVLIGSGDIERKAVKRYDVESWFAGEGRYRETHSVSNCTDYQSRRFEIKINGSNQFAHTLNGTLATERLLLAVIENSQGANGAIELPDILK